MARKTKASSFIQFDFRNVQVLMIEASNVARWKPALALVWMQEARDRLETSIHAKLYNKMARRFNETTECIENSPYYDKRYYWRVTKPGSEESLTSISPVRIEEIDETPTIEELLKGEMLKNG